MANRPVVGTRIQSVARAGKLLAMIASMPEAERTAASISAALGTSLPTTYHLLNTLVDSQLLTRGEGKRYHLGVAVGLLAAAYDRQTLPPPALIDPLREITAQTGESTYLSGWRHGALEVVARFEGTHTVRVANLKPGFSGAAHARASGKVLLAFATAAERENYLSNHELTPLTSHTITDPHVLQRELRLVSKRGYATEEEEFVLSVGCISVPVQIDGVLLGAFTISAPMDRYRKNRRDYLDSLRRGAEQALERASGSAPVDAEAM